MDDKPIEFNGDPEWDDVTPGARTYVKFPPGVNYGVLQHEVLTADGWRDVDAGDLLRPAGTVEGVPMYELVWQE